jgi:hypothetical protein
MARVDAVLIGIIGNLTQADFDYLTGRVAGRVFVGEYLDDLAVEGRKAADHWQFGCVGVGLDGLSCAALTCSSISARSLA